MTSRELKIGDIIKVGGGKETYEVEILNRTPASIKYRYTDFPKTSNWVDHDTFDNTFNILEVVKEGTGKTKERKTPIRKSKKK